ncbi:hypothetical protein GOP47_0006751 [Adiantum capillus-veneris]|uniref:Uncharacterized protein n=1 Tax=Adiantum capillus-veneris TaxID=13818 RepID=A0A9D4V3H2_ADICA|nr:hypothetical protein GOP47_0006751 [Adiantum capillus-veneris]
MAMVRWCGDAAQIELSNSGDFFIYNSAGAPVFRGQNLTDTLVQGQRLSVGMQLTSSDSAYSARVEKGGLALYLNSMRQGSADPAAPYCVFPFFRNLDPINSPAHRPVTLNQLLHSSPPNDSCIRSHQLYIPPYISVGQRSFFHHISTGEASLLISSGSNCSSTFIHELSTDNLYTEYDNLDTEYSQIVCFLRFSLKFGLLALVAKKLKPVAGCFQPAGKV